MDNLRSTIEILFNYTSAQSILDSYWGIPNHRLDQNIDGELFCDVMTSGFNGYNYDQSRSIYAILSTKWIKQLHDSEIQNHANSIFNVLSHFTQHILTELNDEPLCKYEHFLRWHEMSSKTGEDLLTTSYLALNDSLNNIQRENFCWRPVLTHDNNAIKQVFSNGIPELHFHLKGSSLHYDLNWLSLMNDITNRKSEFDLLNRQLNSNILINQRQTNGVIYDNIVKAGAIRVFLSNKLFGVGNNKFDLNQILLAGDNETAIHINEIQFQINYLKHEYGRNFGDKVVDYLIPSVINEFEENNETFLNSILSGERWFLYSIFRKIYERNEEYTPYSTLFYFYLSAKLRLRKEIIQFNRKPGFGNFSHYETRKDLFIKKGSVYESLIPNLAINASFNNQTISYLEARVTPKSSILELGNLIVKTNNDIKDHRFKIQPAISIKSDGKYRYILHYIKYEEKVKNNLIIEPRNSKLRRDLKKQTLTTFNLKCRYPSIGNQIVGIDAANTEFGCRPEVFAQAYRFLKSSKIKNRINFIESHKIKSLHYTYHIGEDFYDLIDGLRAIDEALLFLNLKVGDRLGHALVLGVDPKVYYKKRNYTITMPKQDFLDNVAWLIVTSNKLGIEIPQDLSFKLKSWFEHYFGDIFSGVDMPSVYTYYQAWLLRGDNPEKYINPDTVPINDFHTWDKFALNNLNTDIENARKNQTARLIYFKYHYDFEVKDIGSKSDEYKICSRYIDLVSRLQNKILETLSSNHIAIETNLTSNKLIGDFEYYDNHPITKFYNNELEVNPDKLKACPQISVSINTDDQGVFATSVEKEYSLMALSLEKKKDADGDKQYIPRMIYKWLEDVRKMGNEQKFDNT